MGRKVDEPMQYPWTLVVGLETDGDNVPSLTYVDDITPNRVHEVIGRISCTPYDSEIMLN